jgi:copper chaperone CopZ
MSTIDLTVEGMSCGSCVKRVTQALQTLPGVGGVEVDLSSGHVQVSGELGQDEGPLIGALAGAGYSARLASNSSISATTPPRAATGCHSGRSGGCGCR